MNLKSPYKATPLLPPHTCFIQAAYLVGIHPGISVQCPGIRSQDWQTPWLWVLPIDPTQATAIFSPSKWHAHTHSSKSPWHAETSFEAGTHGGGCCVPTTTVHGDRCWHLTAILLPSQRYLVHSPVFRQWWSSAFNFHIVD